MLCKSGVEDVAFGGSKPGVVDGAKSSTFGLPLTGGRVFESMTIIRTGDLGASCSFTSMPFISATRRFVVVRAVQLTIGFE
jgi:hypothetical protein